MSGCGGEEAEHKRLELQRSIDEMRFEPRPGQMRPLTMSIGAAIFPHDGATYETLLATADSRMYVDKTHRQRLGGLAGDGAPPVSATEGLSASDLRRAATGVI